MTTQSLWLTGGDRGMVLLGPYRGFEIHRMCATQLGHALEGFDQTDPLSGALVRRWLHTFRSDIAVEVIEDAEAGGVQ